MPCVLLRHRNALLVTLAAGLTGTLGPPHRAEAANFQFPLKVAPDRRHLIDQKGRPFLYQADTAFLLFTKLSRDEALEYLRDRRVRGFTAIQATLTGLPGQKNQAGEYPFDNEDFSHPNEKYFAQVDQVVRSAEALGLLLMLAPIWTGCCDDGWGGPERSGVPALLSRNGPERTRIFGRFLAKRYERYGNVAWVLGGDADPLPAQLPGLRALAQGLREGGPRQLITYHPTAGRSSAVAWTAEPALDLTFVALQPNWLTASTALAEEQARKPPRPVVLGQGSFETGRDEAAAATRGVRRLALEALLGGAIGSTYASPVRRFARDWKKLLGLPGADNLKLVRALLESRPWQTLVPLSAKDPLVVEGHEAESLQLSAARAADGSFAMIYVPSPRKLRVDPRRLTGKQVVAWWWNPRTGTAKQAALMATTGVFPLLPPLGAPKDDWVLVMDSADKKFPAPGGEAPPPVGPVTEEKGHPAKQP